MERARAGEARGSVRRKPTEVAVLRCLLLLLLLPSLAVSAPVRMLVEGAHGGVSEPLPALPIAGALSNALGADWERTEVGFGALRLDGGWIITRDGGLRSLGGAAPPSGPAQELPTLETEDWILCAWPPTPGLLESLTELQPDAPRATLRAGSGLVADGVVHLALAGAPPARPTSPLMGEARMHVVHRRADGVELHLVGRHRGEGARRVALQSALAAGALRLAAGNVLEGRSFLPGQAVSLQRDVSWQFYVRDGLDLLVPAHNELLVGIDGLRTEAAAAGVQIVSSNLFVGDTPAYATSARLTSEGRQVLVLGWTPPSALAALSPAERATIEVRGPDAVLDALQAALAEAPADLVVLVGLAQGLPDLPGIDLALTDFDGDRRRPTVWLASEQTLDARRQLAPLARDSFDTPRMGAASLTGVLAEWDDDGLSALSVAVLPVPESEAPDPAVRAAVQEVRQGIYVGRADVLVPDPARLDVPRGWRKGAVVSDTLDPAGFALLTGNLMIERTGADIALLPPLHHALEVDGDRSELVVDASLAVVDDVVLVRLLGSELKAVLTAYPFVQATPGATAPADHGAWIVGAQASRFPKLRGKKVADGDAVLVAMSDRLLAEPAIAALTGKARVTRRWAGAGWTRRASPGGEAWPLRELVRDGLVQLRGLDPSFGADYARRAVPLLADLSERTPGRLALEIDDLRLGVSGSVGFKPATGYEESNETRTRLVNSVAADVRGRIALSWSDRIGEAEAFVAGNYSATRQEDIDDPIELADDLLTGVELQLRLGGPGQRLLTLPLSAYLQSVFDTEWSRADDLASPGEKLARQMLLRTSAGVTLGRTGILREAWFGGFLEADLAAEQGVFAPGLTAGLRTLKIWGALRWSNLVDVRGYFATPQDSASDLSLRANVRTDLVVVPMRKLLPGLGVGGFIDALVFRGAVPGLNQTVGVHLLVGAELSYNAVLRAPVRIR